jgi:periplasmic divalent cation tolerance protein
MLAKLTILQNESRNYMNDLTPSQPQDSTFPNRSERAETAETEERFPSGSKPIYKMLYGLILTTTGSREEAETIAQILLEEHLAACVNYFEIHSMYRWQGEIHKDPEWQLLIKTNLELQAAIESRICALHSYELPEFIVIPLQGGSDAYLQWLAQQVPSRPSI